MTMQILKKWITDTLKTSVEYTTLCNDALGSTLNFYRSSPADRPAETLPFLTAFSGDSEDDLTAEYVEEWRIPIAIGIDGEKRSIDDDDVTVWESTDKAELLITTARDILKKASSCGIKNEDVRYVRSNYIVTEIGEADDVQASMFITFGKINSI